jgi:uncharacterized OB-fold protein
MKPMAPLNDTLEIEREASVWRTCSKPYWDATREKKLLLQFDPRTGRYQFYPRPVGLAGGRRKLEWREVSGKGEIFSYTIARRTREPFRGHEPFLIVLATLDEGVNVMANMVDCTLDEIKIGLRVKPYWAPLNDGTHLLMFTPDRAK